MTIWSLTLWGLGCLIALQVALVIGVTLRSRGLYRRPVPTNLPGPDELVAQVGRCEVRVYAHGDRLFNDMLAAIEGARKTIFLETYIWKGDELGERFKQALARKAAQGVGVYVIYDTFANMVVPRSFFQPPPPGLHLLPFRTWRRPWHTLDLRRYGRDHRKILVVDSEIGFVGGYNIGELYRTHWRDTHLGLRGPEVDDLTYAFVDFWNQHRRPDLPRLPLPPRTWSAELRAYRNDPVRLIFPIRSIYIEAIEQAQRHIYLTSAYFIPDESILRALIRAAGRGVDVRVLLPWQSNHALADWLARHGFERCLRGGVRLFAYQNAMIHAKSATIDGVWSTVGTANFDRLSLAGNYEINLEVFSPALAEGLERLFMADLQNAVELSHAAWRRRGAMARATELLLSPLWPFI